LNPCLIKENNQRAAGERALTLPAMDDRRTGERPPATDARSGGSVAAWSAQRMKNGFDGKHPWPRGLHREWKNRAGSSGSMFGVSFFSIAGSEGASRSRVERWRMAIRFWYSCSRSLPAAWKLFNNSAPQYAPATCRTCTCSFEERKLLNLRMHTCCWSRGKRETQTQARKREHNRDSTTALQHIRLLGFFSLELIRCSACGLNLERVVEAISGLVSTRELVPRNW
jgi:hypothetical protein